MQFFGSSIFGNHDHSNFTYTCYIHTHAYTYTCYIHTVHLLPVYGGQSLFCQDATVPWLAVQWNWDQQVCPVKNVGAQFAAVVSTILTWILILNLILNLILIFNFRAQS